MLSPAADTDLAEVADLINASYRGEAAERGWTNENAYISGERISAAQLAALLARRPQGALLLYRESPGGPPAGCVWLEPEGDDVWYLGLLAIRPDLQDRRIGRGVVAACEDIARGRGGRRMRLTVVHVREELIAWYERRGYVLTGGSESFPQPERALGELHLVVLEKPLAPQAGGR